ncbi:hypothetical protein ACET3Z_029182 [Daucus carota]
MILHKWGGNAWTDIISDLRTECWDNNCSSMAEEYINIFNGINLNICFNLERRRKISVVLVVSAHTNLHLDKTP